MLHEAKEGIIFKVKARSLGGSTGISIPKAALEYAGIVEGDDVAIKCEKSRKYGQFLGIGKLKIEVEKED